MREIKFRAWDKTAEEMKDWEFYCDIPYSLEEFFDNEDELIPMQYIGLKDCKGVEIYEGDILKNSSIPTKVEIGFVHWDRRSYQLVTDTRKWEMSHMGACGWEMSEVIGNIYENPELLEGIR